MGPKKQYSSEKKSQDEPKITGDDGGRRMRSATRGKDPEGKYNPTKKQRKTLDNPDTKIYQVKKEENRGIVEMLNDMSGQYYLLGDDQRGTAYQSAAKSICETDNIIHSGDAEEHFRGGVGENISHYIEEFLETGKVKHLQELHERVDTRRTSTSK